MSDDPVALVYRRTFVFLTMLLGGLIYQTGKIAFGYSASPDTFFDQVYWTWAALFLDWRFEKSAPPALIASHQDRGDP